MNQQLSALDMQGQPGVSDRIFAVSWQVLKLRFWFASWMLDCTFGNMKLIIVCGIVFAGYSAAWSAGSDNAWYDVGEATGGQQSALPGQWGYLLCFLQISV